MVVSENKFLILDASKRMNKFTILSLKELHWSVFTEFYNLSIFVHEPYNQNLWFCILIRI